MTSAYDTKLLRTRIGGDDHTLVLRRTRDDRTPLALLADDDPDDVLAVTYEAPTAFLERWSDRVGERPRNVGIVGVGDRMRSAAATDGPAPNVVRGVPDSADAAAIRDAAAGYLDAWPADGRTVVFFDSATALLDGLQVDAAVDFLADFCRLLDERGAVGYVCLTLDAHDCATVRAVTSLFDTVVECIDGDAAGRSE